MLLVLIVFDAARKELKWDQAAAEHVVTQWYSELDRGRGFAPFRTVSDAGHCDTCEEHYDFPSSRPAEGLRQLHSNDVGWDVFGQCLGV